jgi:DNA helicase TIP49 (TBP-interacting protein)
LEISRQLGDVIFSAEILEALASASSRRDGRLAARLLGAAHILLEEVGGRVDEDAVSEVREAMDEEAYERAYAEGRGISLDDAMLLGLGSLD